MAKRSKGKSNRNNDTSRDETFESMEQQINGNGKIVITAKNDEQKVMIQTIASHDISFVKGAPGSGKTYIAVGYALQELMRGKYSRIVFSRPVVEAGGERLGYLPGDMSEKIDPYMAPIYETMAQLLPGNIYKKFVGKNIDSVIRVLPLAYMRGISFVNSCIILDEMQNSTPEQVRMVLTRFGEGSKMILCGDVRQSDIQRINGLRDAFDLLQNVEGIGFCTLTADAIVRHPIIARIEKKYEERYEANRQNKIV